MKIYTLEIVINSNNECESIKESIVSDNDTTIGTIDMSNYWDAETSLLNLDNEVGEAYPTSWLSCSSGAL